MRGLTEKTEEKKTNSTSAEEKERPLAPRPQAEEKNRTPSFSRGVWRKNSYVGGGKGSCSLAS